MNAASEDIIRGSACASAAAMLVGLNLAQLEAVRYAPETPIQILAGPGSGKTKVLTSRIAYLILQHSIAPSSICAVTFTNKAANEMQERLTKLIGKERTEQLKMGTFHALCARFLRIHASLVGLDGNFTICDADESKKILASLLKKQKDYLEEKNFVLTEGTVLSMISKAKAKGKTAIDTLSQFRIEGKEIRKLHSPVTKGAPLSDIDRVVGLIHAEYERTLQQNNALDFDDLLLYGVKLFTESKRATSWCRYVLVDEFQDTNTTQYDLMVSLARHRRVTVVGDPDQSIYGWRSAEVTNLARMCRDFHGTRKILLEQNYRSTASILRASLAIVAQDKTRIQKTLHTLHPAGSTPFLRAFATEHAEAQFIAIEIKRLVAHMGGVLRWGDFGILLRFNALSRIIESALQKNGIPSRVFGGHKFFERQEIKNVLAYLQLVDNPSFNPALNRAANVPSRGIGEKTLQEIAARAEKSGVSQLSIMEGIFDGRLPDMKPVAKRKLAPFVKAIRSLRDLANKGISPADLIRRLLELVEFENHLRKTQPDWESKWENVKELITFASEVETSIIAVEEGASTSTVAGSFSKDTPLRQFLQASMLSSEGDNQSEEDSKDKVTISTCHAAKGLEWPVVMVPSTEQGTFPFTRSEDVEEERRLLYVACTRAQGLLYLSHSERRNIAGITKDRAVSEFISAVVEEDPTLFIGVQPTFLPVDRRIICDILNRPLPPETEVLRRVVELERTTQPCLMNEYRPETPTSSDLITPEHPVEILTTFTSSSAMLRNPTNNPMTGIAGPIQHPTAPPNTDKVSIPYPTAGATATTFTESAQRSIFPPTSVQTDTTASSRNLVATSAIYPAERPFQRPPQQTPPSHHARNTPSISVQPAQMHPLLRKTTRLASPNENSPSHVPPPLLVASPLPETGLTRLQTTPPNERVSNVVNQGTKRRLGMGRGGSGYCNKKFKPPT